jgi:acyl-CoA thioesterase FadM
VVSSGFHRADQGADVSGDRYPNVVKLRTMHRFITDMTHRPERDGTVSQSSHSPFYLPLELATYAWVSMLDLAGDEELTAGHFAVVNLTADYHREIHIGEATYDVTLERIGNSSITLAIDVVQAGEQAATIRVVQVKVDGERVHPTPFTPKQRECLERLQLA